MQIETAYFQPKAQDSVGELDMDPEVAAVLLGCKARASDEFVIESMLEPQWPAKFLRHASPQTTAAFYLAKKERLSTGLDSLLSAAAPPIDVTRSTRVPPAEHGSRLPP